MAGLRISSWRCAVRRTLFSLLLIVLTVSIAASAQAQPPTHAERPSLKKALVSGTLTGGVIGATGGAWWGERSGDGMNAIIGAGVLGGVGAASGAISGAATALLPPRRGWKKYAQGAAVGMAVSGLAFWAIGEMNGNVGPFHPGDFRNMGFGHGAMTGLVVVKFGR
jgi:hypothetical protein